VRALVCRRCGKRQRVNPRTIYLGLAGLFLAGLFAVAGLGSLLPTARVNDALPAACAGANAPVAAPVAPAGQPARLTAAELWAAYNLDAVRADRLYKDKPIVVTGRVLVVPTRDFRGNVVLRLGTGDALEMVRATLVRRDMLMDSLPAKGQTVSVACVGRGAAIGAPLLDNCALE
jgi:hypothetical protein